MSNDEQRLTEQDCAVCLQRCHHPTQLPCGHVFCFLCVKGVALQNKKCAMCRSEIPTDYLDHPILLEKILPDSSGEMHETEYQWYYEGRNGWWKYDGRSNIELETAFHADEAECILLLAGALYTINFQSMVQVKRTDPTRRRKVRRDVPSLPAKGIAGIKVEENLESEHEKSSDHESLSNRSENELEDDFDDSDRSDTPADPLHTELRPTVDIEEVSQTLSAISLVENEELATSSISEEV